MVLPFIFFSTATASTKIYTLSLHDALPICAAVGHERKGHARERDQPKDAGRDREDLQADHGREAEDRKSTRLNSSHTVISYAVFCLKKKNRQSQRPAIPQQHPPRRRRDHPD